MTLKSRLSTQISLMIAGVLFLGAAAAVGVAGLHQDFGVALRANQELQQVYTIGLHVALAKAALQQTPPSREAAAAEMKIAATCLEIAPLDIRQPRVATLSAALHSTDDGAIDRSYAALADLSAAERQTLAATQSAADRKQLATLVLVLLSALATALFAAWIGLRQYRAVMRPLRRLEETFAQIGAGRLDLRAAAGGDEEFARLAAGFNDMARRLQSAHDDLQHRVEMKSRQLIQSDRLASVGYLAAGVAHEINNPLGIIAGYGEQSLRRLDRSPDATSAAPVREAIQIICDEAFRCKAITDRLLMLARCGDEARRTLSLSGIVAGVIKSVGGLPRFAGSKIELHAEEDNDYCFMGIEGEFRQAVVNLLVNALEAVQASAGRVDVFLSRSNGHIELTIADNGVGMTPRTLTRVFEPFFSEKRGDRPGTGLGLSVVHAIVTAHGGTIEAESDGPGAGSKFILRIPAIAEVAHAHSA